MSYTVAEIPDYWKTSLEDIDDIVKKMKRGRITRECKSAGGRPIYMLEYGKRNSFIRTANLSSALGAGEPSCYADKSSPHYKPTLFLIGCVHGGEFEGTAALVNLIHILETGQDFMGRQHPYLYHIAERCNLLIIPCANPDGRSHVPFNSFVGKSHEDLRYFNQGTWQDGTLCNWPDCKKVHPIKEKAGYLGGYFNDDGVNMMHDNFFGEKAAETEFVMRVAEEYAPDFTILLHGGSNTVNCILKPAYAPLHVKEKILELEKQIKERCETEQLKFSITPMDRGENRIPPASFNLTSAIYHLCGAPCVTYESNQGLSYGDVQMTYEEIYREHIILFEETLKFIQNGGGFHAV